MTTGTELFDLKKASKVATASHTRYSENRRAAFGIGAVIGLVLLPFGTLLALVSARIDDSALLTQGLGMAVLGLAGLISTAFNRANGKKLKSLEAAGEEAKTNYYVALLTEMNEYGIDISSIESRNDVHDDEQEFTALRNGVISDITVRKFGNELVLMMNGERLTKKSLVGA